MATLHDLVEPYIDGLNHIRDLASTAGADYVTSNTTFGNTADKLRQASQMWTVGIAFQGLGADAFFKSVQANQARAGMLIAKLHDFQVACDNTSKAVETATTTCNDLSNYYLFSWSDDIATTFLLYNHGSYEFVEKFILETLIDTFVHQTTLDRVLDPTQAASDIESGLELGAYNLTQLARGWMFQQYQRICDEPQYKDIISGPNPTAIENVAEYKQVGQDYNATCALINDMKSRLFSGMSTWVLDMQVFTESCGQDMYAAAALNMPTLGDMITLLNTTYKGQSVVILRTSSGGLLVLVNGSGANSGQVEADIQQYMRDHGIQKCPITLVGYQGGTKTAQSVVEDLYNNPKGFNFTVPNVVMVGGTIPDRSKDLEAGTNYLVYQMLPGENGKNAMPTAEQWTLMGITAVAGVALSAFTGGGSDEAALAIDGAEMASIEGEAGTTAAESAWLTAMKEEGIDLAKEKAIEFGSDVLYNGTHPEVSPGMSQVIAGMANNQYSTDLSGGLLSHPYVPVNSQTQIDPNTGQPLSPTNPNQSITSKQYYDHLLLIPDEEGMNKQTYMNSMYLNRQPIPDPVIAASPQIKLGSPPINLANTTDPNALPLGSPEVFP